MPAASTTPHASIFFRFASARWESIGFRSERMRMGSAFVNTFADLLRFFCCTMHPIGERTAPGPPLAAFDVTGAAQGFPLCFTPGCYLPLNKVVVTTRGL
jgi:hypothetical protein